MIPPRAEGGIPDGRGPGCTRKRPGPGTQGACRARATGSAYFRRVPVERRFAHASTTRAAMPASASLPQLRGS
ncbi:hypothetical protein GCM10020367_34160 [Streptomyces sannanensis]|uniref:Uncharacterized protein n=1 Tax=Streptomyces sannanensis TaxID=285536 RepID=A0ABP6SD30_9ACTN